MAQLQDRQVSISGANELDANRQASGPAKACRHCQHGQAMVGGSVTSIHRWYVSILVPAISCGQCCSTSKGNTCAVGRARKSNASNAFRNASKIRVRPSEAWAS